MRRAREAGVTMVELIVAVAIAAVVLAAVAGVFFSSLATGRAVQTGSITASQAQVAAAAIMDRVANGSDAQLTAGPASGDQLLVVRSAGTGASLTWRCHGWYYRAADGALLATDRATGTPGIGAPTGASPDGWSLVAAPLEPGLPDGVFALAGREVRLAFDLVAADAAVRIDTGAVLRNASAAGAGAGQQCF